VTISDQVLVTCLVVIPLMSGELSKGRFHLENSTDPRETMGVIYPCLTPTGRDNIRNGGTDRCLSRHRNILRERLVLARVAILIAVGVHVHLPSRGGKGYIRHRVRDTFSTRSIRDCEGGRATRVVILNRFCARVVDWRARGALGLFVIAGGGDFFLAVLTFLQDVVCSCIINSVNHSHLVDLSISRIHE
jgi:hypothetical protein